MKKTFLGMTLLALLFVAGCIESTTLLDVNRDGSGKIVVREFMSPQITQMMDGMGDMFAGVQQEGGEQESSPPEEADIFKDMIEGNLEKFGESVKLVGSKRLKNKQGWKGYEAVYSFEDVNAITIPIGDMEEQGGSADMGPGAAAEAEDSGSDQVYTFNFATGQPATLEIVPVIGEEIDVAGESGQTSMEGMSEMEEGMEEMGAQMMDGMGAMMGQMLKGMRLTFLVRVDGEIKETNSAYKWTKRPNVITVMDMPIDKMLGNSKAMELLQSQDEDAIAKIEEMDISGLKLEPPKKTIEVTF